METDGSASAENVPVPDESVPAPAASSETTGEAEPAAGEVKADD